MNEKSHLKDEYSVITFRTKMCLAHIVITAGSAAVILKK